MNTDLFQKFLESRETCMDQLSIPSLENQLFEEYQAPPFEETPLGEYFEKTEQYRKESIEILKSIQENTANLATLVSLINQSNDNQDQIIELLSGIFAIAKAKSKEEAEGKFKKVMSNITTTVDSAEAMAKLSNWALFFFNMVITVINNTGNLS